LDQDNVLVAYLDEVADLDDPGTEEEDVVVFGNEGVEVADLDDPDTEEVVAADIEDAI
jgi:hypothetical protein